MIVAVDFAADVSRTPRARQLEGTFDVPPADTQQMSWRAELPIEQRDWSVGLIVGPSGCGKSTILRELWGEPEPLDWNGPGVIDDFSDELSIEDVANVCSAVGFNTIPAWLRPFDVLSLGERFRVELARRLSSASPSVPLVFDEWTSVVDRQVARIGSHAAQRYVRRNGLQLIAATCHTDVEEWLQPDWVLEPRPSHGDRAVESPFRWRSVQPRPAVQVEITPAHYATWELFAPFHYLTASLSRSARCYVLWARTDDVHDWQPAAFAGLLARPTPRADIWGKSRTVVLPDWQGLGLAFVLGDTLGAAYKRLGKQLHGYPAHPAYIAAYDRSPSWQLVKEPRIVSGRRAEATARRFDNWRGGGRPNAVFRYCGPAMESRRDATLLYRCGK